MKEPQLELVTWRDAHFEKEEGPTPRDYMMQTVGWTNERGRWLVIRGERDRGDRPIGYRAVTRVPLENVIKRERLRAAGGK